MSQPGWYPDPGGAEGQFRFWDGNVWSPTTSPTPGGPPGGGKKPKTGLFIGLGAGVIVVAIVATLLVIFNPFAGGDEWAGGDTNTSTPTQSSWDETSSPSPTTPPPSGESGSPSNPNSSGGSSADCAAGDPNDRTSSDEAGKLTGGGLTVNQVPGWTVDGFPMGISYAYDVQSQSERIELGWYSNLAVGALKKSDGFTSVSQSAEIAMQCMASSGFYQGFQKRTDLESTSTTISGHDAYLLKADIFVTGHEPIEGDVVTIIVVDTGDPDYFGVYFGIATIDDPGEALVETATASLAVA